MGNDSERTDIPIPGHEGDAIKRLSREVDDLRKRLLAAREELALETNRADSNFVSYERVKAQASDYVGQVQAAVNERDAALARVAVLEVAQVLQLVAIRLERESRRP